MSEKKKFLTYLNLEVEIERSAAEDVRRLLEDYVLGTEGGLRYRQLDIPARLAVIREIWFMSLRKYGRLLGTVGFVRRQVRCGGELYNSYYIRYFSIRSNPVKKELRRKHVKIRKKGGLIREQVERFMGEADRYLEGAEGDPSVMYAYIEEENAASMQMSGRMGYRTVRHMDHTWFSRLRPRRREGVVRADEKERGEVLQRLREMYKEYTLFHTEGIFEDGPYYLFRDADGTLRAGLQARVVNWQIVEMPGVAGLFFRKILPHLPVLGRLFDGKTFRFLSLEGLFFETGYEKQILPLVETALHEADLSLSILWHDTRSSLRETLHRLPGKGFFGKVMKAQPADVRMRFLNMTAEEKKRFRERPAYVAAFDVT
jgi:hypothetical protein